MAPDLKEVVSILHSGEWCSLSAISCNVKKGTGGKVITLRKCRILRRRPIENFNGNLASFHNTDERRDPNHNLHFTRNIEVSNGGILKIHPILIFKINNQVVL